MKGRDVPGLRKLRNVLFVLAGAWTALLSISLIWSINLDRAHTLAVAEKEARANFNKDLAFRKWATRHGGVYVPTDARTPPNPNLAHVPERDLVTPSGRRLTLMNPAYMLRQMMQEYGEEYGIRGRITSLKLLNPANAPDSWEHHALSVFQDGVEEISNIVDIDGQPYLRLMRPMVTQQGCLKCHASQGYKIGDIRGGVGVAVPLAPYFALEREGIVRDWLVHGGIWLLGLLGLGASGLYGRRQIRDAATTHLALLDATDRLELVLAASGEGSWDWNLQSGKAYFDPRWTGMLGYAPDAIEASYEGWKGLIHPDDGQAVQAALQRHLEGLTPDYEVTFRMRAKSGAWKWIQAHGKVVARDAAGTPVRMAGTHSDIDARKAMEQELIELAQRNQLILNSAGEGIFGLDREGRHTFVNPAAARMLGYLPEELVGRHSHATWHGRHPDGRPYPAAECPIYSAISTGKPTHSAEDWFLRKDGRFVPVEFWVIPTQVGGEVTGAVVSFIDISERKQATEAINALNAELETRVRERTAQLEETNSALTRAKEAAESANRAKSVFLANMSHELRTPLNAILGFSDLLQRNPDLSEPQQQNLAIIHKSGDHLLGLINDILEIAKIEAGRVEVQNAPFDLGALVLDVTDILRIRAQDKGLQLLVDQSSQFPRYIVGDETKLRQILINLISNAIKATERGGVSLRLGVRHNQAEHLIMEVEDTGIGISPADQARIFDAFVQLGSPNQQKGTGLGLTITRQFVELMGGRLSLTSRVGVGTTFRVELPVQLARGEDLPVVETRGEVTGLEPGQPDCRVLVVEDHLDNRLLLARLLEAVGLTVEQAGDGAAAIDAFQRWQPHFIWMDRRMPVVDGVEATRRIRALAGGDAVKIVAVTASTFKEEDAKLAQAGFDAIVHKPFRPEQIYEVMHRLLGLRFTYATAAPGQMAEIEADLSGLTGAQRAALAKAAAELDTETCLAMVAQVRAEHPAEADSIADMVNAYRFDHLLALCERS